MMEDPVPIYEFACTSCRHEFEELAALSDRDRARSCPKCGRPAARKVSVFGFKSNSRGAVASTGGSCGSCASHSCGSCRH